MKVVQARPDTWVFRFDHAGPQAQLEEAWHVAEGGGHGRWTAWGNGTDQRDMAVTRGKIRGRLAWRTPLTRGVSERGTTTVTVGAVACATLDAGDCYALASTHAARFGALDDVRLQRMDLAADIAGARPRDVAAADWVVRGHPRRAADTRMTAHHDGGGELTGWTIAPGNALKAVLYDKRIELRRPESEHKRELEELAWTLGGWDGAQPVARLEFQIGARVCKELSLEPGDVDQQSVWTYLTGRWGRIIDSASHKRRDRADVHPIWRAAREARFEGSTVPASRVRAVAGPTAACAVGTVRSLLASRGDLPPTADLSEYAARFAALAASELAGRTRETELQGYLDAHHDRAAAVYGPQRSASVRETTQE